MSHASTSTSLFSLIFPREEQRLRIVEHIVALLDDALAQLDDATNSVAARLDALAAQVAGFDADAAAKVQAEADHLRTLAADPANPVPSA